MDTKVENFLAQGHINIKFFHQMPNVDQKGNSISRLRENGCGYMNQRVGLLHSFSFFLGIPSIEGQMLFRSIHNIYGERLERPFGEEEVLVALCVWR